MYIIDDIQKYEIKKKIIFVLVIQDLCFYLVIIVNNMVDELKENVGKCYDFFFVFF